jgi:hypothetical protein
MLTSRCDEIPLLQRHKTVSEMIIKSIFLSIIFIFYFVYTIRYLIQFSAKNYFTGRLKTFHILMLWLVPFIWIILLKSLFKPTPGSYEFINKEEPDSLTESGLDVWTDSSTGNFQRTGGAM